MTDRPITWVERFLDAVIKNERDINAKLYRQDIVAALKMIEGAPADELEKALREQTGGCDLLLAWLEQLLAALRYSRLHHLCAGQEPEADQRRE